MIHKQYYFSSMDAAIYWINYTSGGLIPVICLSLSPMSGSLEVIWNISMSVYRKNMGSFSLWLSGLKPFRASFAGCVWRNIPDIVARASLGSQDTVWLERRTLDRKVASSNPGRSGGRIFFPRLNFAC